jgi:hypothetical protein
MRKFIIWTIVIIVIVLSVFLYWKYSYTYSSGYRAGLLQKFSYRGNIFKTYEGEMVLSSIQSNKNVALASEKFLFSVTDEPVAKQMEQYQGMMVTVHYREKNGVLPWRGDTPYIVDSVRLEK